MFCRLQPDIIASAPHVHRPRLTENFASFNPLITLKSRLPGYFFNSLKCCFSFALSMLCVLKKTGAKNRCINANKLAMQDQKNFASANAYTAPPVFMHRKKG